MKGKITRILSNSYSVLADLKYECRARGKFRNQNIRPLVGDNVIFDKEKLIIDQVLPRKNYLIRPPVSNIDQALIITSVKEPELDLYLLDKLLCIIEYNSIKPIICFTKLDLLDSVEEIDKLKKYYQEIGYQVFYNNEIEKIKKIFKDKITVITGQSGAGKSTLFNSINKNLELKTGEISLALGRGKHTTRHVELIDIEEGMCADTPGFSSIDFDGMSKIDIRDNMIEFNEYTCLYRDCLHVKEDDCQVKKVVGKEILMSRYENYLKFLNSIK